MQFFIIYIREAHAIDGHSPLGGHGMPIVEEPSTLAEREAVCNACIDDLGLTLPALIDGIDNAVNEAYAAAPDRLYLIGKDGNVAYQSGPGPFGFKPDELAAAIEDELGANP